MAMTQAPTHRPAVTEAHDPLTDVAARAPLDVRLVHALAGERELNAREQASLQRLQEERGESLYADMLYALTHKAFPSRQARTYWQEIIAHRKLLNTKLGRDVGIAVATHDYLTNIVSQLKSAGIIEELKLKSLTDVARRDGLTGLYDKKTFHRFLEVEFERQKRYGRAFSLVVTDIDHFKALNDTHGHADGDIVLAQVADIIAKQCRGTDIAGRVGGEEFAVLLAESDAQSGLIFAERLRAKVEQVFAGTPYAVTLSLGLAEAQPSSGETADSLFRKADSQLYVAKNSGRNRVAYLNVTPETVTKI